jgi:methionine sulfoxide reductase heme-binding subunit
MLIAAVSGKSLWYLSRGSGAVSLILLTGSIVAGVASSVNWGSDPLPRFVVQRLHRNLSLVGLVFVAVHVVAVITDGFVPVGWLDVFVPFVSSYRGIWLGLGALSLDLTLAVIISSLLRVRIGYSTWRTIHWLGYVSWPVALIHGLGTGSDTRQVWMVAVDVACCVAVLGAVMWRLWITRPARSGVGVGVGVAGASLVAPVVIAVWAATGPMQPGWGRTTKTVTSLSGGFVDELSGTLTRSGSRDDETITIDGTLRSGVALQLVLQGQESDRGGLVLRTGDLVLTTSTESWDGPVTALYANRVDARVTDGAGDELLVAIDVRLTADSNDVDATVTAGT